MNPESEQGERVTPCLHRMRPWGHWRGFMNDSEAMQLILVGHVTVTCRMQKIIQI